MLNKYTVMLNEFYIKDICIQMTSSSANSSESSISDPSSSSSLLSSWSSAIFLALAIILSMSAKDAAPLPDDEDAFFLLFRAPPVRASSSASKSSSLYSVDIKMAGIITYIPSYNIPGIPPPRPRSAPKPPSFPPLPLSLFLSFFPGIV